MMPVHCFLPLFDVELFSRHSVYIIYDDRSVVLHSEISLENGHSGVPKYRGVIKI